MSVEGFIEELRTHLDRGQLTRFSVTRADPLTLDELTGDEVLTEGDGDFSVGGWVQQYRKTYGFEVGDVVLVAHEGDGWTAMEVEHDGDLHDFKPPETVPTVTGSRGGNAALASLLSALEDAGIINDGTTA